ncbi:MAG: nitroreductase family protein [Planctomycetes bacterium]|nr:nitroreductase family protein [Planctomycetota bacterium]
MGFFRRRGRDSESERGAGAEHDPRDVVRAYHFATRHDFHRYASGPLELDWATQPDPFRRFAGAPLLALERPAPTVEPRFEPAYHAGSVAPRPFDRASVSQLCFDAFAITAWKQYGDARWALRANPSSGNLHPTEAYVLAPRGLGLHPRGFVAHYASDVHALEVRAELSSELDERLSTLAGDPPRGFVFVGLSSIVWREAWKYGERAFRYAALDLGHALGALAVAAAALGWRARRIEGLAHDELAALLCIDVREGPEAEEPETWVLLEPHDAPQVEAFGAAAAVRDLGALARGLRRLGRANDLSPQHVDWPALEAVARATRREGDARADSEGATTLPARRHVRDAEPEALGLRELVRRRRNAQAFDSNAALHRDAFFQTLARTSPGGTFLPHRVIPGSPKVDLAVWVHRVAELESGLYLCVRAPSRLASWREWVLPELAFERVETAPHELELFRLRRGDVRSQARSLACHQELASDGCFSVAAFVDLEGELARSGAAAYRDLHWEAGFVVHLLYLEAEALGLSGTGIGCFFDEPTRAALGVRGSGPVPLYQFACGRRRDDPRLTTLPAYE